MPGPRGPVGSDLRSRPTRRVAYCAAHPDCTANSHHSRGAASSTISLSFDATMGGEVDEVRHHSETDLRTAPNRRELHVVGTVLSDCRVA
jgi:hypothetical protein